MQTDRLIDSERINDERSRDANSVAGRRDDAGHVGRRRRARRHHLRVLSLAGVGCSSKIRPLLAPRRETLLVGNWFACRLAGRRPRRNRRQHVLCGRHYSLPFLRMLLIRIPLPCLAEQWRRRCRQSYRPPGVRFRSDWHPSSISTTCRICSHTNYQVSTEIAFIPRFRRITFKNRQFARWHGESHVLHANYVLYNQSCSRKVVCVGGRFGWFYPPTRSVWLSRFGAWMDEGWGVGNADHGHRT
jgi:hypothetical protein